MDGIYQRNPERSCSLEQALELVLSELVLLSYQAKILTYGERFVTSHCFLCDQNGYYLDEGLRKGIGIQSKVSAIFEALKHYFSRPICQPHSKIENNLVWSKIYQLPNIDILVNDNAVELLLHHPDVELPCRTFHSSLNGLNCINILIPVLENFHLIKLGKAIVPNRRGTALIHDSSYLLGM